MIVDYHTLLPFLKSLFMSFSLEMQLIWLAATNSLQGELTAECQRSGQQDHHTTQAEPDGHRLPSLYSLLQILERFGTRRMFA